MLEDLPLEILEILIGHLPTASSIINLSVSNRNLYKQISADKYALLRSFVQKRFPSIQTPPFWQGAAVALTARSRAWDRRAFVARECQPPRDASSSHAWMQNSQKFGYIPVIDSYESWPGSAWVEKHEVLAWGAAGRLRTRVTQNGTIFWSSWRTTDDHLPQQDILDVRLLRPEQNRNHLGETIILRRANGEISKVESSADQDVFNRKATFASDLIPVDCMDINRSQEPLMAVCKTDLLGLFSVNSDQEVILASDNVRLEQDVPFKYRKRCIKFLSDERLAIGVQFLAGRIRSPVGIYDLTPSGLVESALASAYSIDSTDATILGRHCANTIAPLDLVSNLSGRPGEVFLTGWTDGVVRLYDLRTPTAPRIEFYDPVDDGQILSLLPIGHERFLAGSHHNACLKTFDMRMPGARSYSHTTVGNVTNWQRRRDFNIFLAVSVKRARPLWEPLPQRLTPSASRYRGSIYSLSSPSPSSTTVYAGIENHVIQLDFVSTDDVRTRKTDLMGSGLSFDHEKPEQVHNLSCYERPRPGCEQTDAILLRKQVDWLEGIKAKNARSSAGEPEDGWDDRWRLATHDRQSTSGSDWRGISSSQRNR